MANEKTAKTVVKDEVGTALNGSMQHRQTGELC